MNNKLPIRVLQIGMTKNIGGLESYLMQQFNHLDRTKIIYDFVNITDEYDIVFKKEILSAGSHIYGVRSRHSNPFRHYWQWYCLLRKLAQSYDAIVLNSNGLTYVFPLLVAKWFGIPQRIMHSHNSGFGQKFDIFKKMIVFMNTIILRCCATRYLACSKLAGNWMFGRNTAVTIIHNAIETDDFVFDIKTRNRIRKNLHVDNLFVIGNVASFSYQKNHIFLIDVFKAFHDKHPESVLWLIGGPDSDGVIFQQVKEKVHKFHLDGAVQFWGMRKDVADLYQAMDCFVLPSHFEGLPVVGIEVQAAGLPCIMSTNITEEVKITNLVEFVPLTRPAEWMEKLEKAMGTPRRNMKQEIINAGYDIDHEIKKVEDLYFENN